MVSIVIVTYNAKGFIKTCLDSVFNQEYKDLEVIVVDNSSRDETAEFVSSNYPVTTLIKNNKNEGACYARNQGIEIAKGEYILFLDCDIILEKEFLSQIIKTIKKAGDKIGMVQGKILKPDKKTIFSTGIYLSRLRRFNDIGKGQIDCGQFNRSRYIFGACAAAALYKKEMVCDLKINGEYFDKDFFFLVEDVDLAWRAQKRGWKAIYCPEAICYHFGNSSGYAKDFRQYLCFRNRYFMMLKNDSILRIISHSPILIFYDLPRFLYLLITNKYTLKAIWEIIKLSPRMLKKQLHR